MFAIKSWGGSGTRRLMPWTTMYGGWGGEGKDQGIPTRVPAPHAPLTVVFISFFGVRVVLHFGVFPDVS